MCSKKGSMGAQVWYVLAGIALTGVGVVALCIPAIVRIEEPAQ